MVAERGKAHHLDRYMGEYIPKTGSLLGQEI